MAAIMKSLCKTLSCVGLSGGYKKRASGAVYRKVDIESNFENPRTSNQRQSQSPDCWQSPLGDLYSTGLGGLLYIEEKRQARRQARLKGESSL